MTDRLVMWDFDGTLACRPGLWPGCVMEVLQARNAAHGVVVDQVRAGLQDGFPWHRADEPHPHPGNAERWWEAVEDLIAKALAGAGIERAECAELARATRARFIDPTVGWRLFDDAVPALTAMTNAGWTNVVVSNHVPELADLVSGIGLDVHFDRVFTSALVGFDKPNPEFFRHVARIYDDPDEVWMVGDNPVADIAGAEAVGHQAILVRTSASNMRHYSPGLAGATKIILGSSQPARSIQSPQTADLA
jgi:putative hydrolase of the HAD superfamily